MAGDKGRAPGRRRRRDTIVASGSPTQPGWEGDIEVADRLTW